MSVDTGKVNPLDQQGSVILVAFQVEVLLQSKECGV